MKKLLGLALACAAILILVGCEDGVTLEAPDVEWEAADNGAILSLTWTAVEDADGYIIYADGDSIDEVTATEYDADVPAALYEVSAYAGEDESDRTEIDCAAVVTLTLEVWGNSDVSPDHPSGFGFNTAGTAIAYALSDPDNHPFIDYYINSVDVTPMEFWSPHHGGYNDEVNVTQNSGQTDFDAVTIAAAPGGYSSQTDVVSNAVYYFWIDPTDNGWDNATDYFGKIKVEAIDGVKATMTVAFQTITGLRWVVTD